MRSSPILEALFPAVRQGILAATLLSPDKSWYLSELAAHLNTSPSSLQRELEALARSGILTRREDGRRTYYKADTDSPVFGELHALLSKTAGIVPVLKDELAGFRNRVQWAAIYGSVARGEERTDSDIDLLVVGSVGMADLVPSLRRIEQRFGREVNVTHYSADEFRAKRAAPDHFLNSVLKGKLITIAGSLDDLEKTASGRQDAAPHDQQKRTRQSARAHRARS
ncbi:MAG: helix-turn-helix domain-containing protein [Acidobacteria bacterium]|nr:helix-turn-helix domain-containing protein [Acidobacteriota bacterium]